MPKPSPQNNEKIVRSTGNVFAGLGFADAAERQTRVRLALAINELIERRGFSQSEAAGAVGINQPKVSALAKYRLEGFSVEGFNAVSYAIAPARGDRHPKQAAYPAPGPVYITAA